MNTPFADRFSESARRYVARIGSLYERAKSLVAGSTPAHGPLAAWEWHRTSAQACVDEAILIYIEGLETLLAGPVEIQCIEDSGVPRFICFPGERQVEAGFDLPDDAAQTEGEEAADAVRRAFGSAPREVRSAFAVGLRQLHTLGAFKRTDWLKLQPQVNAETDTALSDPGGMTR